MLEAYGTAIATLFQPVNLLIMAGAIIVGLMVGILPGIGGITIVALILPFLFGMRADVAFIMLIGLHAVINTSGGITSILLNIPGETSSAATCLDGYPMSQKGEAGRAISAAVTSSMAGGVLPVVFALAMVPMLMPLLLAFGQPEMAALVLVGISFIAALSGGSVTKGIISGMLGLLLSFIGYHTITGINRFTFGNIFLSDGINLIPLALGLFGLSELLELGMKRKTIIASNTIIRYSGVITGMKDVWQHRWLWLRSTIIGYVVGIIPGIGGQVATWVCYGQAKQTSKHPEEFGKGTVEGVIAPEAADNAKEAGSLLTTMAFGLPGGAVMTLMLAAFAIVGVSPGPRMMTDNLPLVLTILLGVALANLIGGAICLLAAPYMVKLTSIHVDFLFPVILVMTLAGVYVATQSPLNFVVVLATGILGIIMKVYGYSRPALILGFALGEMFENYSLLSIKIYGPLFFLRPIPIALLAIAIIVLCYPRLHRFFAGWSRRRANL